MKVGLLTYHHTSNFGSLLQTYALYRKIKELGMECEIIDYRNDAVEKREKPVQIKELTSVRNIIYYFIWEPKLRQKIKNINYFLREQMNISERIYTKSNILECRNDYNCYVVGSDLVWDFDNNGHDTTYMLDFVDKDKKKIAYASSVGSIWKNEDKEYVVNLLDQFDYIGVRETIIEVTLNQWLNKKVDFVGDPTILITPEEWKKLADKRQIKSNYVICYFEDNKKKIYEDAKKYGKVHSLPVYAISYKRLPYGIRAIRPTSINEFLSLILNAEVVFSASYHGMLFSLYFEKELYYYKKGWNARMDSIAEFCGLRNREGFTEQVTPIDYNAVNKKLSQLRQQSNDALQKYLLI